MSGQRKQGRRGNSGGRGGGAGGGAGRLKQVSKRLSLVLRHQALDWGLECGADGYVPLAAILKHKRFVPGVTVEEVQQVVADNDKQRFHLKKTRRKAGDDGGSDSAGSLKWWIRASQGHSMDHIDADALLELLDAPLPVCVHGTYLKCWDAISAEGLCRMARNHVHCAVGLPGEGGVISGMRGSVDLVVYVDMARAMEEGGIVFYRSANGVILTPGVGPRGVVPPQYFHAAVRVSDGVDLLLSLQEAPQGVGGTAEIGSAAGGVRSAAGGDVVDVGGRPGEAAAPGHGGGSGVLAAACVDGREGTSR